ncbi:hypothetical protein [Thaumasiovibrio subtropicus]|nr:hypothetical protein [Thaumasiovibrio subtropicus]
MPPAIFFDVTIAEHETRPIDLPIYSDTAAELIADGNLAGFRKLCGDEVTDTVTMGRAAFFAVYLTSDSVSHSDRNALTGTLQKGVIEDNPTVLDELVAQNPDVNFIIKAYTLGNTPLPEDLTLSNLKSKVVEFEVAHEQGQSVFKVVTHPHLLVESEELTLLDYQPARSVYQSWLNFIDQNWFVRCPAEPGSDHDVACDLTYKKYESMAAICRDHSTWNDCYEPSDKACTLEDGSYCNVLLNYEVKDLPECIGDCEPELPVECEGECDDAGAALTDDIVGSGGSIGFITLLTLLAGGLLRRRSA